MNDFKTKIEELRGTEFTHLNGKTFLDHAANTIYMKSVIHDYYLKLTEHSLFSNPHSNSESGIYTNNCVLQTRQNVLGLFNANSNDYDLVFVSNATHGLKTLAEMFQFDGQGDGEMRSCFAYLNDNHTSVMGMRELVWQYSKSCDVYCVYENEEDEAEELNSEIIKKSSGSEFSCNGLRNLFVYPAQSNFNGRKYPLDWISRVQDEGDKAFRNMSKTSNNWFVCLDAASFVCNSRLDLSANNKPDFVVISFYKIFGFPTGLGGLLIRKNERTKSALRKVYFGGGTISMALVNESKFEFRNGDEYHDFIEDGTISYLDIVGLNVAMKGFSKILVNDYMSSIEMYVKELSVFCYQELIQLRHYNDEKLVFVYRIKKCSEYGPIIAFNLMDSRKNFISYVLINKLAQEFGIHLRVGCFCNIGACKMHLKNLNLLENFQLFGHKCGDHIDLINGQPTGACRVSFGYCSTRDDVLKLVEFLNIHFVETKKKVNNMSNSLEDSLPVSGQFDSNAKQYFKLVNLFIYPIKSAAPFEINTKWPLSEITNSLLYDRNWVIIDANQIPLTQKRLPTLVNLHASIDLKRRVLKLVYNGSSFSLDLDILKSEESSLSVCIKAMSGYDCGDLVSKWLQDTMKLDYECRLVRLTNERNCGNDDNRIKSGTFSNQADFLLISSNSIRKLRKHLLSSLDMQIDDNKVLYDIDKQLVLQFRANFVVEILSVDDDIGNEESWQRIKIDDYFYFKITSLCTRCQVININQSGNNENKEILSHLLKELNNFKKNSKFGVYLKRTAVLNSNKIHDEELAIGMIGVALFNQ